MGSEVHFDNFHKKLQTRTGVLETFFGDEVWAKKHPKQYKKLNLGYKVNIVLAILYCYVNNLRGKYNFNSYIKEN